MNYKNLFKSVTILTLAWVLLASISGWSSETNLSRSVNIKPEQEISEVMCNLLQEKQQWQVSEIPKFKAYIPKPRDKNEYLTKLLGFLGINSENEKLLMASIAQQNCQIQVDNQWYLYKNPDWTEGGMGTYSSIEWLVQAGAFIPISLDPKHWITRDDSEPLVLEPGKHTISFGWAGIIKNSNTNINQKDKPVLLASKPIKIEILKSSEPSEKMSETEEHRFRVTELFNSYVHANSLTKEEQELGLKTNLRTFYEFFPKFTWEDIPLLLELAKNDSLHKGMPRLGISSYIGRYCREGMIALWFIEGLRREQVSLKREIQIGEKLHVASYRLPLNSICVKKDMKLEECEQSLDIHKTVLQAYLDWWQMVSLLPAPHASAFHPLDLTDLEWYGGESYRTETLVVYKEQSSSGTIAEKAIRHWKYKDGKNQSEETFQTIYYTLKNPDEKPPFTADKLKVQKIVLHYYDAQGNVIKTEDILPADK